MTFLLDVPDWGLGKPVAGKGHKSVVGKTVGQKTDTTTSSHVGSGSGEQRTIKSSSMAEQTTIKSGKQTKAKSKAKAGLREQAKAKAGLREQTNHKVKSKAEQTKSNLKSMAGLREQTNHKAKLQAKKTKREMTKTKDVARDSKLDESKRTGKRKHTTGQSPSEDVQTNLSGEKKTRLMHPKHPKQHESVLIMPETSTIVPTAAPSGQAAIVTKLPPTVTKPPIVTKAKGTAIKPTKLQAKMAKKLEGARFRWLNEQLYTISGDKAKELFSNEPVLFDIYHTGFRKQVEGWPSNPLDIYCQRFIDRAKTRRPKRGDGPTCVVADMGCGEAVLAHRLAQHPLTQHTHTVHSFDLVAANARITACDMAHVPLADGQVDVCVFCLSLMGTNWSDFVREALRILKPAGQLWIAEVASRFTQVDAFCAEMNKTFDLDMTEKDDSNNFFTLFTFKRRPRAATSTGTNPDLNGLLKPCLYKRR